MKKLIILIIVVIGLVSMILIDIDNENKPSIKFNGVSLNLTSTDGIKIKADLYETENKTGPVILLFHQAGFSRGEYRTIAPKLNDIGFTCLAIDQRSGNKVNEVINETHKDATAKGKPTKYADAYPDLEAALTYAKQNFPSRKIIVWGSSYSASLVFILTQKNPESVAGIVAFSPGEYFEFQDKQIKDYAKEISCPVFISSAKNEHDSWKGIYDQIPGTAKTFFLPDSKGIHGSRALWESTEGHEKCWESLKKFLFKIKD